MTNTPPENDTPIFNRTAPADDGLAAYDELIDENLAETDVVTPAPVSGHTTPLHAEPSPAESTSDTAKGAAQDVAGDAKDAGARVAGTAKEQASRVASEATDHARQLLGQAGDGLKEQAGEQQQRAAGGLKNLSAQLSSMADGADEGVAQKVVRDLSHRAGNLGSYLEGRDPGSLLDEVKSFAARRPGTFIAIAAGAGILAGRLTKALTTEVKHEKEASQDDHGVGA